MSGVVMQSAVVGVIVLGAAASVALRGWRMVAAARGTPADGACGGCGCGKS